MAADGIRVRTGVGARACRNEDRTWVMVFSALCLALANAFPAQASESLIPVAVVDFSASGRTPYQSSVPEFVIDELVNSGDFDVLEREKLRTVAGEIGFQAGSGLVLPESAVQMGRMLGARLLVTGHIIDHGRETREFKGYGISTTNTTWRLKARIEVIDVTTGSKLLSHIADASTRSQTLQGQSADSTQRDLGAVVARQLVGAIKKSRRIRSMVDGPEAVAVTIRSDPPEADVEVGGTYYGTAGQPIRLIPGIHNIRVSLPGYQEWSKRVMVQEGTNVVARLRKDDTVRTETQVIIDVNKQE